MSKESKRFAARIRSFTKNRQSRDAFIAESVRVIKEQQAKNAAEYEQHVSELFNCLECFDVVDGPDEDVDCELTVLDLLLNLDLSAIQVSLCTSNIRLCLKSVHNCTQAASAANTFSAALTYATAADYARTEVEEALERISYTGIYQKPQRVCGMMVLTEVARRIPMLLLQKLDVIFDKLWDGLSSPDTEVRPHALALFNVCTALLSSRPQTVRAEILDKLMTNLKMRLSAKAKDKRVAALLAFEPMVMNVASVGARETILRYDELSIMLVPFIMGSGISADPDIRELTLRCLVVLCRFNTPLFVGNQLKDAVHFALDSVRGGIQRGLAFAMLSEIIPIVSGADFHPFAEPTCAVIKEVFAQSDVPCWESLRCFSVICTVCPPAIMSPYVDACTGYVFRWGLSSELTRYMPSMIASSTEYDRERLEEGLLDMISITLCDLPFRQQAEVERLSDLSEEKETPAAQIAVALNALTQFGFTNSELMGDFLRDSVLPFIDSSDPTVRNAAIHAIVTLLIPHQERGDLSIARVMCIDAVISRMLVVALSDPHPAIRLTILSAFTDDFYPYLSEQQFLFHFYSALGDESIDCRIAAIAQLCSMATYDPSHILPALREEMVSTLHFIDSEFNPEMVQNGLRLLTAISANVPRFVVNFTDSVVGALRPHFARMRMHARPNMTLAFLHCCTAFLKAVHLFNKGKDIFVDEVPMVCELLSIMPEDRGYHDTRLSCLRFLSAALGPLVRGEMPYKLFPSLYPLLSNILRDREESIAIRLEAVRCIGVIGALDAHIFQSLGIDDGANKAADNAVIFNRLTAQKCSGVALRAIVAQIDPSEKCAAPLSSSSRDGLIQTCLLTILNIAGRCPCSHPELNVVIAPLARVLCQLDNSRLLVTLLYEYANIIKCIGESALREINAIVAVFNYVWDHQRNWRFLVVRMLSVVATFQASSNSHSNLQQAQILSKLFDALHRLDTDTELRYSILDYIVHHVDTLQGCCAAVVGNLLAVITDPASNREFLASAITALKTVCAELYVDELVGSIVRSLLERLTSELSAQDARSVSVASTALFSSIMGVFCILCEDLQGDFLKYSFYITQSLKAFRIGFAEYSSLINQVANGVRCARSAKTVQAQKLEVAALTRRCEVHIAKRMNSAGELWTYSNLGEGGAGNRSVGDDPRAGAKAGSAANEGVLAIAEQNVLATIRTVPLTREEWSKWADQFSVSILKESPYLVFRCTSQPLGLNAVPLVERSRQFIIDVVQVAFRALWSHGTASLRFAIVEFFRQTLRQAMGSSAIPDEALVLLLSIIEYMDHVGETMSVSYTDLSECAWSRGMLAKALFWREAAYRVEPVTTVESLISLYSELHMVDSSVGILNQAPEEQRRALLQSSLVKLARYTEALELTERELAEDVKAVLLPDSTIFASFAFRNGGFGASPGGPPGGTFIRGSLRASGLPRRAALGSSSNISSSFVRTGNEDAMDRKLEATARLMLCHSELGDYTKVLDEWALVYRRYGDHDGGDAADGAVAHSGHASRRMSPDLAALEPHSPRRGTVAGSAGGGAAAPRPAVQPDDDNILTYVSQYAADAAIRLQSWDTLRSIVRWMPSDTVRYHVSAASLNIVDGDYDAALGCVTKGRQMLLEDLDGLLHESYARAYEGIVIAQELTEVEEIVAAKTWEQILSSSEQVDAVSKLWEQRMRMMSPTVPAWKQVLGVHGLLIPPERDVHSRIRFVKLCRQGNAKQQEKFTLDQLLGFSNPTYQQLTSSEANPRVVMQYVTYLSASGGFGPASPFGTECDFIRKVIDVHTDTKNAQILSRAYARLGTKVDDLNGSIECYKTAAMYDPKWYLAWRLWAESNVDLLEKHKVASDEACTNAIHGFIRSIQLGPSDSTLIQDVLKLLTHWTKHCDQERGLKTLRNCVLDVPSHVWHLVVPQLVARLDSGSDESCRLVADVLTSLAYDYPHTLLYPLYLCTISDSSRRKDLAREILAKLEARFPVIVVQGRLMVDELIRVSGLIYEQWYDKLEEAATAYFGRHNKQQMIDTLLPMHKTLKRAPETIIETEFHAKHTRPLTEAKDWMKSYTVTKNPADLQAAWNLYHGVYRLIDDQMKANNVLRLQFCSPKLFEARDLAIGVPDARPSHRELVSKISSFQEKVLVITSKQRPKRIAVTTAEGRGQKFLLKGREDLRLDERVMQLFGLVNILTLSDSRSAQHVGFQIQRYSVTPLKDTVGLIGWVDGCDTLHELVKVYRDKKGVPPELEMRMLNQIITYDNAKAYDYMSIMSKVEVMEFLADNTSGHDIRKAMWALAPSCEAWMDQRQMFTASLANMSMVGYILGLGDRHPNNIMVQKSTGLIVHIDFGDCFEVAMTRDKFPEKVPFRLTRMLRNALDVSGVDGAFRANAETSMWVLREGSHSILALMEAFIQDPLISWRLINRPGQEPESSNAHKTIEQQHNLGGIRQNVDNQTDSIAGSVGAGRRGMESFSVAKHLFGEEVDVVHQGVFIFGRLSSKLKGEDFITADGHTSLDPPTQVNRLICEATDMMNLAQSWSGWYPYW